MVKGPKMHIFWGVLPIVKSMQRLISPSLLYRNQHNKVNPENPWNTPNLPKIPCLHLFSFVQNIASHKLDITSLTQKHWDCKFFLLAKRKASLNKKEQHKKQGQSEIKKIYKRECWYCIEDSGANYKLGFKSLYRESMIRSSICWMWVMVSLAV